MFHVCAFIAHYIIQQKKSKNKASGKDFPKKVAKSRNGNRKTEARIKTRTASTGSGGWGIFQPDGGGDPERAAAGLPDSAQRLAQRQAADEFPIRSDRVDRFKAA